MLSRLTGSWPRLAALAGAATVLAACASGGGTSSSGTSHSASALSARQVILLAAKHTTSVTSFNATVSASVSQPGSGTFRMAGTMVEQLSPSLRAEANFSTLEANGIPVPGGADEIITSKALYVKMSAITQGLHTAKTWVQVPLSAVYKATGLNLSSLFSQAQANNPLTQTQMLAASPDVHKVGTGTINGVPVTEYAGSYSIAKALASLPPSSRAAISAQTQSMGIKSAQFHVWIDGQQQVRKITGTLTSSKVTETVSETITSVNQPVTITPPPAAETYVLPASALPTR